MVPTLKVWYRVLINKLAYDLEEPLRGDIDARLLADVARIALVATVTHYILY